MLNDKIIEVSKEVYNMLDERINLKKYSEEYNRLTKQISKKKRRDSYYNYRII